MGRRHSETPGLALLGGAQRHQGYGGLRRADKEGSRSGCGWNPFSLWCPWLALSFCFIFVFSIWGSSGALVRVDQPLCLYLSVYAHIHVSWLSVWGCWALACCFVHGVACVPESLEEHLGLCASTSMFASLCATVYLCCVSRRRRLHL